jgi:hypothetical protein
MHARGASGPQLALRKTYRTGPKEEGPDCRIVKAVEASQTDRHIEHLKRTRRGDLF